MASTVNTAFDEFMENHVNLDPNQVSKARDSRNWLIKQINTFPEKYDFCRRNSLLINIRQFARAHLLSKMGQPDTPFSLGFPIHILTGRHQYISLCLLKKQRNRRHRENRPRGKPRHSKIT